jgi:hypothetical protein
MCSCKIHKGSIVRPTKLGKKEPSNNGLKRDEYEVSEYNETLYPNEPYIKILNCDHCINGCAGHWLKRNYLDNVLLFEVVR